MPNNGEGGSEESVWDFIGVEKSERDRKIAPLSGGLLASLFAKPFYLPPCQHTVQGTSVDI